MYSLRKKSIFPIIFLSDKFYRRTPANRIHFSQLSYHISNNQSCNTSSYNQKPTFHIPLLTTNNMFKPSVYTELSFPSNQMFLFVSF